MYLSSPKAPAFTHRLFYQGSGVGYSLYESFNATVRAAQFVFLPFLPPTAEEIAANNITLSNIQKVTEELATQWIATNDGYFLEQTNKVHFVPLSYSRMLLTPSSSRMTLG